MRAPRAPRGVTLLEVMISLSILLIGLLGTMKLQIWGFTSNEGARAQMEAMELARELAAGITRLPFGDPRLVATDSYGKLVWLSDSEASAVAYDVADTTPIPGVRPETEIAGDRLEPGRRLFRRRWTVLDVPGSGGAKVVAVSVIYREKTVPTPREVV